MLLLLFVYFLIPKRIGWDIGKQHPLLRGITSCYQLFSHCKTYKGDFFGCLKHVFIASSCANIGFLFVCLLVSQVAGTFHDNSIGHIKMNYVVSRLVVITNKEVFFFPQTSIYVLLHRGAYALENHGARRHAIRPGTCTQEA